MQIQPVKVERLYLKVAEQLRELIGGGVFEVGKRLPSERDLAAQFGVSRPTLREAMIALESAGLVEVRSGSGVYVLERAGNGCARPDSQAPGPCEILEAQMLIEGETCALAAERIADAQLDALARLVDARARVNLQREITEDADQRFHCLIAEASGNSALAAAVTWLWQLRNGSGISAHFQQRVHREGIHPIIADHRGIVDALAARDPDLSRAAMRGHLQRVIDQLMEVV